MSRKGKLLSVLLVSAAVVVLASPVLSAINFAYLVPGLAAHPANSIPKVALLTFDDGPDATSVKIARYLAGEKIPAVFFLVGKKVQANPEAVREIASYGFTIGNHSMNHVDLSRADNERLKSEVDGCSALIQQVAGLKPLYFRPPYGAYSKRLVKVAQALGLTTLLWTVDPFDWAEPGPDVVRSRVLASVRPGSVILLHSNHEQTLQALPGIVKGLREKGYRLVSVQEWFNEVLGAVPGSPQIKQEEKAKPQQRQRQRSAETLSVPTMLGRTVVKHKDSLSGLTVFTNIVDESALFAVFRSNDTADGAKPAGITQWQEELPARIVPEYRADFLLNRRDFAKNVYPQPAMFLLTTLEELPSLDPEFLRTLAMQGGITEMLVIQPSEGTQGEIGDIGIPAKYVPIYGFDATAAYDLSTGAIGELLSLYAEKKEAIFILLSSKDFATPEARANLENAAQIFLRFRQLTCERLYDPADDLRGEWLPKESSFARFSGEGSTMFVISATASQSIMLPRTMRKQALLTLPMGGEGTVTPLQGRLLMISPDPLYLLSE